MEKTIWLHVKSGHFYVILDIGLRERDLEPEFEYKRLGEGNQPVGVKFHRTVREFLDGRFTQYQVNGVGGEVVNGERPAKRGKLPASSFHHSEEDDLIPAPKTGRPALDADENHLKVGDWVQPVNVKKKDAPKLPVGQGPYEIKRVQEDDHPQIFFDREKDATGWYPAVFTKVDAPYDTLE